MGPPGTTLQPVQGNNFNQQLMWVSTPLILPSQYSLSHLVRSNGSYSQVRHSWCHKTFCHSSICICQPLFDKYFCQSFVCQFVIDCTMSTPSLMAASSAA